MPTSSLHFMPSLETLETRALLNGTPATNEKSNHPTWDYLVDNYLGDDGTLINAWNSVDNGLKWAKAYVPAFTYVGGTAQNIIQPVGDLVLATALHQKSEEAYNIAKETLKKAAPGAAKQVATEHLTSSEFDILTSLSWIAADILQLTAMTPLPGKKLATYSSLGIAFFNFAYGSTWGNINHFLSHYGVSSSAGSVATDFDNHIASMKKTPFEAQKATPEAIEEAEELAHFALAIANNQAPWSQIVPSAQAFGKTFSISTIILNIAFDKQYWKLSASTMTVATAAYVGNSLFHSYFPSPYAGPTDEAINDFLTALNNEYQLRTEATITEFNQIKGPASTFFKGFIDNTSTGISAKDGLLLAQEGATDGARALFKSRFHL